MLFHITYRDRAGAVQTCRASVADDPRVPQSKLRARAMRDAMLTRGLSASAATSAVAVSGGRPALGRRS